METSETQGYPARTMAGEEVRIVEKHPDPQRGTTLEAEDGTLYVVDAATSLLIPVEDAPLEPVANPAAVEAAKKEKAPKPPKAD